MGTILDVIERITGAATGPIAATVAPARDMFIYSYILQMKRKLS